MAADVDDTLPEWSTTESSNKPSGGTSVGTNLDDNIRMLQKVVRGWLASKGADIASASTTDLGAVEGLAHDITGSTAITSFGTIGAGILKVLTFEGALTLTHNATSLILPGGANITTASGDTAVVISEGSGNWRCVSYQKASGLAVVSPRGMEAIESGSLPSANNLDIADIPQTYAALVLTVSGASSDTASRLLMIRQGSAATGYAGTFVSDSTAGSITTNFGQTAAQAAAQTLDFSAVITGYQSGAFTNVHYSYLAGSGSSAGGGVAMYRASTDALTTLRLIWNDTGSFDAGTYALHGVN
jgi:hypothetical protein